MPCGHFSGRCRHNRRLALTSKSTAMHPLQVCKRDQAGLSTWQYVLVSVAALAMLCLLVMLASLFVSLCLARTGKVRRQLEWWKKHISGMPQTGKMSIVVTDIEGYSGKVAAGFCYDLLICSCHYVYPCATFESYYCIRCLHSSSFTCSTVPHR
jgi:hypothetical protein